MVVDFSKKNDKRGDSRFDENEVLLLVTKEIVEKQSGMKYSSKVGKAIVAIYMESGGKIARILDGDIKEYERLKDAIVQHFSSKDGEKVAAATEFVRLQIADERGDVMKEATFYQNKDWDKDLGQQSAEGPAVRTVRPGLRTDPHAEGRGPATWRGQGTDSPGISRRDFPATPGYGIQGISADEIDPTEDVGFAIGDSVRDKSGDAGMITGYDTAGLVLVQYKEGKDPVPTDLDELEKVEEE